MVIPVKTGIYFSENKMDPRFRGYDKLQNPLLCNKPIMIIGVKNDRGGIYYCGKRPVSAHKMI